MANNLRGTLIGQLRLMLATRDKDPRNDADLLNRFLTSRDEVAFTILVARHGPVVWDICIESLENTADAEEVFQKTFMLLSQRAGTIIKQKSVSSWLIGVAQRSCWSARRGMQRQRRILESATRSARPMAVESPPPLLQSEIAAVLREEVACLPETLRVPLALRYLEEKTLKEIAFLIGCTDRGVAKRLDRGESILRRRLVKRGMCAGSASLGALLATSSAKAAITPRLMENVIRAAMEAPPGGGWLAGVSGGFGRLLGSRLGLGLVVFVGLLCAGGVYGLVRFMAADQTTAQTQPTGLAAQSSAPNKQQGDHAAVGEEDDKPAKAPEADPEPIRRTMPVSGQVVDSAGKAIPDARIAVLAIRPNRKGQRDFRDLCLLESTADADGRYRINVPTDFPTDFQGLALVKMLFYAPGRGLAVWSQSVQAQQNMPLMTLDVEKPFRGRILDSRGQPAAGVRVAVARVGMAVYQDALNPDAADLPPHWPKTAITDAEGRYEISGLGRKEFVQFVINDERHGLNNVPIEPGQEAPADVYLRLPRIIKGRVVGADNHKPLVGVRVVYFNDVARTPIKDLTWSAQVTDAEGRFRMRVDTGLSGALEFAAPDGMSYMSMSHPLPREAKPDEESEFTLSAGTLLKGRVVDGSTGKPIANVGIRYAPAKQNDPDFCKEMRSSVDSLIATDAQGRFSMAVTRAGGHLLVQAQEDDYRVVAADLGMLTDGVKSTRIRHMHAVVPIDAIDAGPRPEMKIELQRGLSIKGRVVQPNGQALKSGYLICRRQVWASIEELRPIVLTPQGMFSLDGCEPGCKERVLFLDSTGQWGAMADLMPPAAGGEPVTIRAQRCGHGTVTLLNGDGTPMPDVELKLMVNLPEPGALVAKPTDRKNCRVECVPPDIQQARLVTDQQGKVTLPFLVPNASYQLMDKTETFILTKPFEVASGQIVNLKIRLKAPGN